MREFQNVAGPVFKILRSRFETRVALLLAVFVRLSAQMPVVFPGGVVNAASYTQPVASGSLVSIFGTNLANGTYHATATPLPATLEGTSVTINGVPAPLVFVSPGQINAQASYSLTGLTTPLSAMSVVVSTSAGNSLPVSVSVSQSGPGVYTTDGSGCGQAAALNVATDGTVSVNGLTDSAAPGDFVEIFGNGFGNYFPPPADGTPTLSAQRTYLGVDVRYSALSAAPTYPESNGYYVGSAPGLVGTDQVNFQIPLNAQDGCSVPINVTDGIFTSPTITVSVHSTRGRCADPATQAYGNIQMVKKVSIGTSADGETDTLNAIFPFGPGLVRPAPEQPYFGKGAQGGASTPPPPTKFCPVPGYGGYSVGTLGITGPTGASVSLVPGLAAGQTAYSASLPSGFLGGGAYRISTGGSSTVAAFQASVSFGPPIQITSYTNVLGGPLTVNWTGGSPTDLVRVSLVQVYPATAFIPVSSERWVYVDVMAAAGTYTFTDDFCTGLSPSGGPTYCTYDGIDTVSQIEVEQMPASGPISIPVAGISGNVQMSLRYKFVFGTVTAAK